jgi:hypothetical protein
MVEKLDNSTPPMYFNLIPWIHESSPSRPSVFRIYVGNDHDKPKTEVMRFSVKFYHKDNLVFRGADHPKAWRNVGEVLSTSLYTLLSCDTSGEKPTIFTADVILWEAFEDCFLHLSGHKAKELNPNRSLKTDLVGEHTFEAFGARIEGNYVCMRVRRNVSKDHRLIVTGFYNTKAVDKYFTLREERGNSVQTSS